MHELSIANSIINTVITETDSVKLKDIKTIGLKIGSLSGVLAESLDFGFNAIKKGTPLEKARLEIEHVPVSGRCESCFHKFIVEDFVFSCPKCHSVSVKIESGQELDITYLEMEEEVEIFNE